MLGYTELDSVKAVCAPYFLDELKLPQPLQKSPQLIELFLAGLSLPLELIPAIPYFSVHWHIL